MMYSCYSGSLINMHRVLNSIHFFSSREICLIFLGYFSQLSISQWYQSLGTVLKLLNQNIPDSKVHAANMGPPGSCWPQMGPILAPWNLLSGINPEPPLFHVECRDDVRDGWCRQTVWNLMLLWGNRDDLRTALTHAPVNCCNAKRLACGKYYIEGILSVEFRNFLPNNNYSRRQRFMCAYQW